jgi:hypothetical protein
MNLFTDKMNNPIAIKLRTGRKKSNFRIILSIDFISKVLETSIADK